MSSLLPGGSGVSSGSNSGGTLGSSSPGQRFMTDLLVGSLMADGGLEAALNTALIKEARIVEEKKKKVRE